MKRMMGVVAGFVVSGVVSFGGNLMGQEEGEWVETTATATSVLADPQRDFDKFDAMLTQAQNLIRGGCNCRGLINEIEKLKELMIDVRLEVQFGSAAAVKNAFKEVISQYLKRVRPLILRMPTSSMKTRVKANVTLGINKIGKTYIANWRPIYTNEEGSDPSETVDSIEQRMELFLEEADTIDE